MTEGACWHIWSGEHHAWWRRDEAGRGAGYVEFIGAAGKWTRAEAEAMTRHCGPEKKIELIPDPYGPDAHVQHDGQHFIFNRVDPSEEVSATLSQKQTDTQGKS